MPHGTVVFETEAEPKNEFMKKALIFLFVIMGAFITQAQTCSTCGKVNAGGSSGHDTGPSLHVSLGATQYGQSAGYLIFSSSLPNPMLFTPAALQFTASSRTDVTVITTNLFFTNTIPETNITVNVTVITNINYVTNDIYDTNGDGGMTNVVDTNTLYSQGIFFTTNYTESVITTNAAILQVQAPQAIADIPVAPTMNGYVINLYFPSQVTGHSGSIDLFSGQTPFIIWTITNSNPSSINQLQISQTNLLYGSAKKWNYTYTANSTSSGTWLVQDLANVQENMTVTNLNSTAYQVINTMQYSNSPVVQQTVTTYTNFSWGIAPIQIAVGSSSHPQITTYTYNGSGQPQIVTHPDGSWQYYASYDANGNPLTVYSSFQDVAEGSYSSGRETTNAYTTDVVSGSGDNGTVNPNIPRKSVQFINGSVVSLSYTAFPAVNERLDIQCPSTSASWNSAGNLVTTNWFYSSGYNQFALQSVIRPDGTMTTYNYITNGTYQTNITVTGQPNSGYTYIVDGTSNQTVLNQWGYNVSSASWDVQSAIQLSHDTYGNFDSYGRPQWDIHLDGTTNITQYACCGLDLTIDPDGLTTQYLYDLAKRQIGYQKIYNSSPITYTNVLDAASRIIRSIRAGSDNSQISQNQSAYDLAGELIAQTNALSGVATSTWTNASTGGFIRTTVNPDVGVIINSYYADGSLKQSSGSGVHGVRYVYGAGSGYTYTVAIKLNASGGDTSEITTNFTDMLGRTYETAYASASGTPASISTYNSKGQLASQIDPDGVTNLYAYNAKGEVVYTAVDMNGNGTIDFTGTDRITYAVNDVTTDHSTNVRRTRIYNWGTLSSNTSNLVSVAETSANGLTNWQTVYRDGNGITPVTTEFITSYASGGGRTVIITAPDNSYTIKTYSYGRLVSSTQYDSSHTQIGSTSYSYDAHGRQYQLTDARNGATTYGYNNADLVTSVTTPNPGTIGGSPQTTTTSYNPMLQVTNVAQPDGTSVASLYLLTGELGETYGSRTYPVGYSYDYTGRMQTMTNWSNFSGGSGSRVTTWNYNAYRGFLTSKTYDGGATGPSYTYTSAGRLNTRIWARSITTTYGYDGSGGLATVSYSDSTPAVTNTYDRMGRLSTAVRSGMTDTLTYNLANQLLSESFSGGILNGLSVTNGYDADLRRTNLTSLNGASTLALAAYGYDNASRLSTVSDGVNNAAYSYLANSPIVSQIVFKQSSTTRMTTTKSYDYLNRLTQISSAPTTTNAISFNYSYNNANQRTRVYLADGSYWLYQYDSLGQVISANKYWSDETPVAGQQFDYAFDTIGNRTQTQSGGDAGGANLRTANYTNNTLNQITSRDVPAYVDIKGVSFATNSVTVNGTTAYRKVEYFRDELGMNNSSSALWTNIIVAGTGQTSVTGNVFVAKEPETFGYDADGNLTNDGRFSYVWDGENRLTNMTSLASGPSGSLLKLDFAYDYQGRRIQKIVSTNNGTSYVAQYTNRFIYDGWNLVAEVNPSSALVRSYMWGSDLSGSPQGVSGVGGLLEVNYYGSATTNCFPVYDGNGNVAALVNAADGTVSANYEYGAFGEPIRMTGAMAKSNPFRFSTKYDDDESDLLYYGYRYYKPSTGTWPNRDPIEEQGGLNLYALVNNQPINTIDISGLYNLNPTPGYNPPDAGKHCCDKPAILDYAKRTDPQPTGGSWYLDFNGFHRNWTINMSLNYSISGPYKDLRIDWITCIRIDGDAGYLSSGNSASFPTVTSGVFYGVGGPYLTQAQMHWLSCEGGVWTIKFYDATGGWFYNGSWKFYN
jgi:RHS repeat-associated protein